MSDVMKKIKKLQKSVKRAKKQVSKKVQKSSASYDSSELIIEIKESLTQRFFGLSEDETMEIRDIAARYLPETYEEKVWEFTRSNDRMLTFEEYFYLVSSISSFLFFGGIPTPLKAMLDKGGLDMNRLIQLRDSDKIGSGNTELINYFNRLQEYDILMMGNSLLNLHHHRKRMLNILKPNITEELSRIFNKEVRPSVSSSKAFFMEPSREEIERTRLKRVPTAEEETILNRENMVLSKPVIITPCMRIQKQAPWITQGGGVRKIYIRSDDWDDDDDDIQVKLGLVLSSREINGKKWYRASWVFFEEVCKTMVPRPVHQKIAGFNIDMLYGLSDSTKIERNDEIAQKESEYYTSKNSQESVIGKLHRLVSQTFGEFNKSNRLQKVRDTGKSQLFNFGEQEYEREIWKTITSDATIYDYFYAVAVIICYYTIFGVPKGKIDVNSVIGNIGTNETVKNYFNKLTEYYVNIMAYILLNSIEPGVKFVNIDPPRKPDGLIEHKQSVEEKVDKDEVPLSVEVPKDSVKIFNEYYYIDGGIEEMRAKVLKLKQTKKITCDYCNEYILNDVKYTSMDIDENGEPEILRFCRSKCLDEHSLGN